jgi:glycosyltransferase involved in cell wall biosynthesis
VQRLIGLYCPDLPPTPGGLPNHTLLLARTLERLGAPPVVLGYRGSPERFAPLACRIGLHPTDVARAARDAGVGTLIVQYVPFLFARRGVSLAICLGIRRVVAAGIRVSLIVHEPFVPFTRLPWLITGWPMRWQLYYLVRRAASVYVSVPRWTAMLEPHAKPGTPVMTAPMGANLPVSPSTREEARRALRLDDGEVAIGIFAPSASGFLHEWIAAAVRRLAGHQDVRWVLFGFGSDRAYPGYPSGPGTLRLGAIDPDAIGRTMRALDIALAPYVDGLTLRRSIPLLAVAHGVATVSSTGPLFDPDAAKVAVCEPSAEAFADRVERLVDVPSERAAAARLTANFDRVASIDVLARRLIADLQ